MGSRLSDFSIRFRLYLTGYVGTWVRECAAWHGALVLTLAVAFAWNSYIISMVGMNETGCTSLLTSLEDENSPWTLMQCCQLGNRFILIETLD